MRVSRFSFTGLSPLAGAALVAVAVAGCDGNGSLLQSPPTPSGAAPRAEIAAPAKVVPKNDPAAKAAGREIFKVPVDGAPARGSANAKVTLVTFSEFQCPFCARIEGTMAELEALYGQELRIVWKHFPLAFHDRAVPAALAAEAARDAGRFWQMHAQLFAQKGALGAADLATAARTAGVDPGRVTGPENPAHRARIDADQKLGETLGVRGTPTFFINGRRLVGAQPVEAFAAVIDEELARADDKLRAGVSRSRLYAALIEGGLDRAPAREPDKLYGLKGPAGACPNGACPGKAEGPRPAAVDPTADTTVYKVEPGNSPARGPKDAPITVVLFSDFECPFCKRVEPTLTALEKEFPGKIRVVWKNFPLAFHANAKPAAAVALAAHQAGRFWEMHGKLLANQTALDADSLARYGREVGIDDARVRAVVGAPEANAEIEADLKLGASVGVTGTPTLFINGRRIAGAHPIETFRTMVQQELTKRGG